MMSSEKGMTIRVPSTANFLIDSTDRDEGIYGTAGDFSITKTNSLLNGFFTRMGVTEIALEWNIPNIDLTNQVCIVDVNTVGLITVTLPIGLYTCADALNTFVALFNVANPATPFSVTSTGGTVTLAMAGQTFRFPVAGNGNSFIGDLGFGFGGAYVASKTITTSKPQLQSVGHIQKYQYLDFVSPDLTYNQDLKDTNTAPVVYDILQRWYMGFTNDAVQVDSLGFPIYMGYKPFFVRREFNPPKQIKWSSNMPVGNLRFQVLASDGSQASVLNQLGFDWYMTIQVSEN